MCAVHRFAFWLVAMIFVSMSGAAHSQIAIDVADDVVAPEGAVLRGLDRITGITRDFTIPPGETFLYERLEISLTECRFPNGKAEVEGSAYLVVRDVREQEPSFEAWMFASSPALSSLDHPRYDVWLLRCKI